MAPENQAAWLDGVGQAIRVGPADMPTAGEGEVIIRNRAIAINPVSHKIQDMGLFVQTWPIVLDHDVAGEVYEVGKGVERFKKGDRVVSWLQGPMLQDQPKYGAFQLYSVAKETTTAKLPDNIPFTEAAVLPVGSNTALVGLSGPSGLGFNLPGPIKNPKLTGKTIVIWGASSSVGMMALQLARESGIAAVAVASKHNHALCKLAGAVEVLDYRDPSVVDSVVTAVKAAGGTVVGVMDCMSTPETLQSTLPILERFGGGELVFLQPHLKPEIPENVTLHYVHGNDQPVTLPFWKEYLTPALEDGRLKCLPEAYVVGEGLESIQKGMDVLRKGVSAKKVVVSL